MKRIGPVAAKLVRNPIELVAAANQKRSTQIEGGDGPMSQGGGEPLDPSPRLNAEGSASNVNVVARKEADAETPASFSGGHCIETVGRTVLDTPLTMSRNMDRGLPHTRRPSAPRSIFLVTIDGVRVHCPPAQAAKSGSARATKNKMAQMTQSF